MMTIDKNLQMLLLVSGGIMAGAYVMHLKMGNGMSKVKKGEKKNKGRGYDY